MKYTLSLLSLLLFVSCENNTSKVPESGTLDQPGKGSILKDTALHFFETDFTHRNIVNTTDRKIDLLFNGVKGYLGGQEHLKINFDTECMRCEPVQEYMNGLLFARRLLILPGHLIYYKKDVNIPDSIGRLAVRTNDWDQTNPVFSFSGGKVRIKYLGMSCNDAGYERVLLSYPSGKIVADSLINASFFEYDLNKNGPPEQYLLGSRTCSKELVILRIRKADDK